MLKGRWLMPVLLVFLVLGCSSKREVFFRTISNHSHAGRLELLYSYDAYHWQAIDSLLKIPAVGDGSIKDPSISKESDGLYHVVWVAVKNKKEGIAHSTSVDLRTWSAPTFICVVSHDSTQLGISTPGLLFDEQTDTCLVYWSSVKQGRESVYALKTKGFMTFAPVQKLYDPGFSVQDPMLVCRSTKDYVLIFNDNTPIESNLKVAFSSRMEGPYERISPSFTAYQTKRPSATKVGAKWFVFLEDYGKNQIKVVSTLDFDSFEDISEEMELPAFTGGGAIFLVPRKSFRKLLRHLHCKPVKEKK